MNPVRLLLVDDHELVRAGLRALLERREDLEVVGEASTGEEAVELVEQVNPDVVLMDVRLPTLSGADATRQILRRVPGTNVLALSVHEEEAYFFRMLEAGARGYVPKRAAPHLLLTAIHAAAEGKVFLHPLVAKSLVQACFHRGNDGAGETDYDGLTPRQREVLTLVADGLSSSEIGERLGISIDTVHRHRANVQRRLDLDGDVALLKYALRRGLVQLDTPR